MHKKNKKKKKKIQDEEDELKQKEEEVAEDISNMNTTEQKDENAQLTDQLSSENANMSISPVPPREILDREQAKVRYRAILQLEWCQDNPILRRQIEKRDKTFFGDWIFPPTPTNPKGIRDEIDFNKLSYRELLTKISKMQNAFHTYRAIRAEQNLYKLTEATVQGIGQFVFGYNGPMDQVTEALDEQAAFAVLNRFGRMDPVRPRIESTFDKAVNMFVPAVTSLLDMKRAADFDNQLTSVGRQVVSQAELSTFEAMLH